MSTDELAKELADENLELVQKNNILFDALRLACKYMQQYPPAEFPQGEFQDIISRMLGNGNNPKGDLIYMKYFIDKVKNGENIIWLKIFSILLKNH